MRARQLLTVLATTLAVTAALQAPSGGTEVGVELTWTIPLPTVEVPRVTIADENGTVVDSAELVGTVGGTVEITWISSGTALPPAASLTACETGASLRLEQVAAGSRLEAHWLTSEGEERLAAPVVGVTADWAGYTITTCQIAGDGTPPQDEPDPDLGPDPEPSPSESCPVPPEHAYEHARDGCPSGRSGRSDR